jgi:hypothetical protein
VADALQVKRPHKEASPFMVEIAWRIDAIAAWLLNRKRKLQATAVASYSTNRYSNDKIKKALNYKFLDMKEYIKTHFNKLEGILFGFEYYCSVISS